ncbi:hypothetical protein [Polaromonas sp.]|uniref:hypothetical protein n=1 Tax=Polaromonas sp. TaxID=1869339 RepID=UPI003524E4E9
MPIETLNPEDLRLTIVPDSLGFVETSELLQQPLPWIGQERAEMAARFGLGMEQLQPVRSGGCRQRTLLAAATGNAWSTHSMLHMA